MHLGFRVRKPRTIDVNGHDHKTHEEAKVEVSWGEGCPCWEKWNKEAEAWLCKQCGCYEERFKGRGQTVKIAKRRVSIPQDLKGEGCDKGIREEVIWLRKARILAFLEMAKQNAQEEL